MAKNIQEQTPPVDENILIQARHDKLKGVAPFGHRYEVTHQITKF